LLLVTRGSTECSSLSTIKSLRVMTTGSTTIPAMMSWMPTKGVIHNGTKYKLQITCMLLRYIRTISH
jgi:hypothetical protein